MKQFFKKIGTVMVALFVAIMVMGAPSPAAAETSTPPGPGWTHQLDELGWWRATTDCGGQFINTTNGVVTRFASGNWYGIHPRATIDVYGQGGVTSLYLMGPGIDEPGFRLFENLPLGGVCISAHADRYCDAHHHANCHSDSYCIRNADPNDLDQADAHRVRVSDGHSDHYSHSHAHGDVVSDGLAHGYRDVDPDFKADDQTNREADAHRVRNTLCRSDFTSHVAAHAHPAKRRLLDLHDSGLPRPQRS